MRKYIITSMLLLATSLGFGYTTEDVPEGWASQGGGTTGGKGGTVVTVSSIGELQKEAGSSGKKIILVKKGNYKGNLSPKSDKSILGIEPGVKIDGTMSISGQKNVIIRNITIFDSEKCTGGCKSKGDAVNVKGSKNIWFDHVDIYDGPDGNFDIVRGADLITVTWCKFWYTWEKEHRFSNLIASSDNEPESEGKLNITFAYNWWGPLCDQRQPRGRYGKIHVVNNLYTSQKCSYACGPGYKMQMLIEHNVFNLKCKAISPTGKTPHAWKTIGNIGSSKPKEETKGSVFTPPYTLSGKMAASQVESKVKAGAGPTMSLGKTGISYASKPAVKKMLKPFIEMASNGWVLKNPNNRSYFVSVVNLHGQTVLPVTYVCGSEMITIPKSASPLVVKFMDNTTSEIYIPVK